MPVLPRVRGSIRTKIHGQRAAAANSESVVRGAARCEGHGHKGLHNKVVLARLGPITLVNFGLITAVGGALAAWLGLARLHQAGLAPERYATLMFISIPLLAVIGSRIFSLALDWRAFLDSPVRELSKPAFAFHGGFIGATAAVVGISWYADISLLMLLDAMALAFPLGHAIGRLACHTYGCCHGRPTKLPLAIRYTNPESKAIRLSGMGGVPLHPTQLYSAFGNFALFLVLTAIALGDVRVGQLSATFLILGSTGRFLTEFIRGEPVSKRFGLTPFQWVAIGLFTCGLATAYVASGNAAHAAFADFTLLAESLRYSSGTIYPLLVAVVIFVSFGIHGRQVGTFGSAALAERDASNATED